MAAEYDCFAFHKGRFAERAGFSRQFRRARRRGIAYSSDIF
jgi:hypothetical protein